MFRHIARPLLAAVFVSEGVSAIRDPKPRAEKAAPLVRTAAERFGTPDDPALVVRAGGGVAVVGGLGLVTGRAPRLSSLLLATTLVPTTVAEHPFWEASGEERSEKLTLFLKNAGLLGGLLLMADPPSLRAVTHQKSRKVRKSADKHSRRGAKQAAKAQAHAEAAALRTEAKLAAKVEKTEAKLAAKNEQVQAALAAAKAKRAA